MGKVEMLYSVLSRLKNHIRMVSSADYVHRLIMT